MADAISQARVGPNDHYSPVVLTLEHCPGTITADFRPGRVFPPE
jgi:hypothetical protein